MYYIPPILEILRFEPLKKKKKNWRIVLKSIARVKI